MSRHAAIVSHSSPLAAQNRAGEQHRVTVTVRDGFGNTVETGVAVEFDVNGPERPPARFPSG